MPNIATNPVVVEIYGDQINVGGRWFHAERVFGRAAHEFAVGQALPELSAPAPDRRHASLMSTPDELVGCRLYRGCSSNEMTQMKVDAFAQIMREVGGWGRFPMITGYVETLQASDVEHYASLAAEGREYIWLTELGWSRPCPRSTSACAMSTSTMATTESQRQLLRQLTSATFLYPSQT